MLQKKEFFKVGKTLDNQDDRSIWYYMKVMQGSEPLENHLKFIFDYVLTA